VRRQSFLIPGSGAMKRLMKVPSPNHLNGNSCRCSRLITSKSARSIRLRKSALAMKLIVG